MSNDFITQESKFFYYIDHLVGVEGGNNDKIVKLDKGGATNHGATLNNFMHHLRRYSTHPFYLQNRWLLFHNYDSQGNVFFDVSKFKYDNFRSLTPTDVFFFYFKGYWEPCRADELPLGLDYYVFDFTVHSGQGNSIKCLQRVVGANPDGAIGPKTIQATLHYVETHGVKRAIKQLDKERRTFLSQTKAGRLWPRGMDNRLKKVIAKCYDAIGDIYFDERKPLTESKTIKATESAAKTVVGLGVADLIAPKERDAIAIVESLSSDLETIDMASSLITRISQYKVEIIVLVVICYIGYFRFNRIRDWFLGK